MPSRWTLWQRLRDGTDHFARFSARAPLAAPNNALRGLRNIFVSKLSFDDRSGTLSLAYSTYLGGSGDEAGFAIAVDPWAMPISRGYTQSPDFPLVHPLPTNNACKGSQTPS